MTVRSTLPPLLRRALLGLTLAASLALVAADAIARPVKLPGACLIEGSWRQGGVQPDYLARQDDKDLSTLMRYAERIGGRGDLGFWQKVDRIRKKVKAAMPYRAYDDPTYLNLNKRYLKKAKPIPIGKYVRYGVGVCRENAILLNMALNRAGIESQFVYASVKVGPSFKQAIKEDHGFALVKHGGQRWVVDSYSPFFNGRRFCDLTGKGGRGRCQRAPLTGTRSDGYTRVLKVNSFPRVTRLSTSPPSPKAGSRRRSRR